MFKNYLKTTIRSLARRKGYSFINIAGLTVGLSCCLIIFLYVASEYSFDRFHEHELDLYRVSQTTPLLGEEFELGGAFTGYALGPALSEAVPEILHVARVHPEYSGAVMSSAERPDRVFEENRVIYTDPEFLAMFTFPLVAGDLQTALAPGTALMSQRAAEKYFPDENPLGNVLDVAGQTERSYRVTGIFKDVPVNSHLEFDFLLPMHDLLREGQYVEEPEQGWSWNNFVTYVQLHSQADRALVDRKATDVYMARRGDALREQGRKAKLGLQPLRDVHLNADVAAPTGVTGSYRTVYFFTVIGLITLLIALVNYINLATARALDRAREVGVRKVIGAHRKQLVVQFLSESALINLIAGALAVAIAVLATPFVNDLADVRITGALWISPWFWLSCLVTFGVCTLLAGLYPAFVLSSFKPVSVLKGRGGASSSQPWLRRALVVFQFAASVVLIGGTVIVYDQLEYMRSMDLGLDLEQVVTVRGPRVFSGDTDRASAIISFTDEVRRIPGVRQVATSTSLPGQGFNWNGAAVRRASADPASTIRGVVTYIDTSFATLYGLELLAGIGFDNMSFSDSAGTPMLLIANETSVRSLGFTTPDEAVDQPLDIGGNDARIVGVVEDFNWSSAHEARQNIFLGRTQVGNRISLRVDTRDVTGTIAAVRSTFDRLFPGNVFEYAFVDEAFDQQYRNEERFATLFTLFAGLAIAIACLGLFGLASFTTQQRTKEIGVRKVLGASVPGLVGLLSISFLELVGIAVLIASPIAYVMMQRWLDGFAYRTEIGLGVFVMVGTLALVIALLTVASQSIRAALTNPVRSLRAE